MTRPEKDADVLEIDESFVGECWNSASYALQHGDSRSFRAILADELRGRIEPRLGRLERERGEALARLAATVEHAQNMDKLSAHLFEKLQVRLAAVEGREPDFWIPRAEVEALCAGLPVGTNTGGPSVLHTIPVYIGTPPPEPSEPRVEVRDEDPWEITRTDVAVAQDCADVLSREGDVRDWDIIAAEGLRNRLKARIAPEIDRLRGEVERLRMGLQGVRSECMDHTSPEVYYRRVRSYVDSALDPQPQEETG